MKLLDLNLQHFAGEKTEKATPKKKNDARKKGQVAKSQDVNTAIGLLLVFFLFSFLSPFLLERISDVLKHSLQEYMLMDLTEENFFDLFIEMIVEIGQIVGPIMLAVLVAGVASNYMQIGFLFTTETIQFKLEKIDPIKGFKRIFSMRSVIEFLKSILKIMIVSIIAILIIWNRMDEILTLAEKSIGTALVTVIDLTIQLGLYIGGVLLFLALLDYMYQRFDFEKNLRMSKQDIKDEYKNSEGDPLIKSKIKQKQREMAMSRMMQEVPNADVIITNPTHFAVALKYDENKYDAPYVVAKGVDFLAQKIKFIAKENNVIMVENRPLARALYSQADIGDTIPEDFFKAVAEILAYVYRTKNMIK